MNYVILTTKLVCPWTLGISHINSGDFVLINGALGELQWTILSLTSSIQLIHHLLMWNLHDLLVKSPLLMLDTLNKCIQMSFFFITKHLHLNFFFPFKILIPLASNNWIEPWRFLFFFWLFLIGKKIKNTFYLI